MNELTTIVKEGQRVLTTQQLAEVYETDVNNIQANFKRNKERFVEGKHYFKLEGEELKRFKNQPTISQLVDKRTASLMLWTEKGADRHCKILDTDKAWEQFDNLEETYFRVKENIQIQNLSKEIQAIFVLDEKQQKLEKKVDDLENNMPLFVSECKEIQSLVRKKGIEKLGGYKSQAYNDKSTRTKVYSDIQHQLKREFGVTRYEAIKRTQYEKAKYLIAYYELPLILIDEVTVANNQIQFQK